MPSREYSDSDDDAPTPTAETTHTAAASPSQKGPRVKLTFRPNINHLVNSTNEDSAAGHSRSERSSLTPPPPLTLKFRAGPSRIDYSDSSDEDEIVPVPSSSSRPAKKAKKNPTAAKKGATLAATSSGAEAAAAVASETAPMRKSYDWLAPSAVGASHSGPPERQGESSSTKDRKISGWAPGDEYVAQVQGEVKKPSKARGDKAPGRGKNWRKGVTKGMLGAWRDSDIAGSAATSAHGSHTPGDMTPSVQGSPENTPQELPPARQPSPPYVAADPAVMGIPVYTQPIAPPAYSLAPWPKVSPWFAPYNGGDVGPFPRKEKVRAWTYDEKTLVGVAGGTLRFKTWAGGPASQLSVLVKADKDAKEQAAASKKAKAIPAGSATPSERPALNSTLSTDSLPTVPSSKAPVDQGVDDAAAALEGDDADETGSVASAKEGSIAAPPPPPPTVIPAKRKAAGPKVPKAKTGPRKSKLAQEIHPVAETDTATSAIEDIM